MASSTVGTAVIRLSFDGSDVKAELSKTSNQFKSAGSEAGSQFGNAMTVAMGSLISKGVSKIVSSIYSNLDSAINRVDVINNFPKVMESLGFSTDEAASSIKVISERLDGLPSTLNGVVGDVQKLTATMGNLNKGMVNATSLGLALNDMFLAGGKGTEAASNAMEQYNQMLAQGKPDMQSWRSILNAAPGQLKQLAQSLLGATASQNDLYEALQKGNVTFDQLNEAIVRLDKEGGDGFDSFEKQARSATGGVGTALENVQNRISKAIAKVIDVIGADNIANAINGISSHFAEVGEAVGHFVKDAMTQIGNFVRFVQNNTWIVDVIKGAVASIIALGIGKKVVDIKNKMVDLFTAITKHPFVALATAIVGVATALSGMTSKLSEQQQRMQAHSEAITKQATRWKELNNAQQQYLDDGLSELKYYEKLSNELKNIVDENGRVKDGYESRANFIVSTLKNALGIEIEMIDGVIQGYSGIKTAIDDVIKQKRAKIILDSQEEKYTEAIKQQSNAIQELSKLEREASDASGKLMQATYALREAEQSGNQQAINEQRKLVQEYQSNFDQITSTLNNQKKQHKIYTDTIMQYEDNLVKFNEKKYDEIDQIRFNYIDKFEESVDKEGAILQEELYQAIAARNSYQAMLNSTNDQRYRSLVEEQDKEIARIRASIQERNNANRKGIETDNQIWNAGLAQQLSTITGKTWQFKNAGNGLVQAFANGEKVGQPQAQNQMSSIVNGVVNIANSKTGAMYNTGQILTQALANGENSVSGNALQVIQNVANSIPWIANSKYGEMYSNGQNLMYGLGNGLASRGLAVVTSVFNQFMGDFKWMFGIHSPSTVFRDQIGVMLAQGLGIGFVSEMDSVGQDMYNSIPTSFGAPSYSTNWAGSIEGAIIEQSGASLPAPSNINVYMNNTIDNDMSIDELGRKFSQSIRRYA